MPVSAFGIENIRIICDIPYIGIAGLECREAVNEHMALAVRLLAGREASAWLEKHSLCGRGIRVELAREDGVHMSIYGDIVLAQWEAEGDQTYINIRAVSSSHRMDVLRKKRVYQRTDSAYSEIAGELCHAYSGVCGVQSGRDKPIPCPLIQYDETDWELLLRIAGKMDTVVLADSAKKVPKISMGVDEGRIRSVDEPLEMKRIWSLGKAEYRVRTWDCHRLGDAVRVSDRIYRILQKETVLNRGLVEFTYDLGKPEAYIPEKENEKLQGKSIRGKIVDVRGEQVRLEFEKDDGHKKEKLFAYWYLPVTGNVMYAMPEKGAAADLYFPTSDEKDSYVRNCFLAPETYPHESKKYLKTCDRKLLAMNPGHLLFLEASAENGIQGMEFEKQRGLTFHTMSKIELDAGRNIRFFADGSSEITASREMELQQTGTANKINMSGNCISMSGERYLSASGESDGVRKDGAGITGNFAKARLSVLASLPVNHVDETAMRVLSAVPVAVSKHALETEASGYTCRRRG